LKCIVAITPLFPKSNLYRAWISLLDLRKGWCNIMFKKATCWWKCKFWMNMSKILWEIRHNLLRAGWKEVIKNVRDKQIVRSIIIECFGSKGAWTHHSFNLSNIWFSSFEKGMNFFLLLSLLSCVNLWCKGI
jgi:hypothetical protein